MLIRGLCDLPQTQVQPIREHHIEQSELTASDDRDREQAPLRFRESLRPVEDKDIARVDHQAGPGGGSIESG